MVHGLTMALHGKSAISSQKDRPEQKIIGVKTDFRRAGEGEGAIVTGIMHEHT
jgi:hypothetical protein